MDNKIFILIIVILVVGFLGFAIISSDNSTNDNAEILPVDSNSFRAEEGSNNYYGKEDAKVVLTEAYSFACPACYQAYPILKELREEYKDQIRFQVIHFPLTASFGNVARTAHRASEAAAMQGSQYFWLLHDKLFEERENWNEASSPQEIIFSYAREIGLDMNQFKEDYNGEIVHDRINADISFMQTQSVSSTPTYFINGETISSAQLSSLDVAKATIDSYLEIDEPEVSEINNTSNVEEPSETENNNSPDTNNDTDSQ